MASMVFTSLAICATFFIKDVKENMTNSVAVTLQNDKTEKEKTERVEV